jgi:hypothetical protein
LEYFSKLVRLFRWFLKVSAPLTPMDISFSKSSKNSFSVGTIHSLRPRSTHPEIAITGDLINVFQHRN